MRYKVITTVRNTPDHLDRCLASIAAQTGDYEVCVVDDASTDRTTYVAEAWCKWEGWAFIAQDEPKGALWNQVQGIRAICADPDDVIVWVDGDDRLARTDTFAVLDRYYTPGIQMTFGSYEPDPPDRGCSPAQPFPRSVVRSGTYRQSIRPRSQGGQGLGHRTNHLRTVKWGLFSQLTDDDFTDGEGRWHLNTPDVVVMVPCLELAGPKGHVFIPETLLFYTSNLASAEWRSKPEAVNKVNDYVLAQPPKVPT